MSTKHPTCNNIIKGAGGRIAWCHNLNSSPWEAEAGMSLRVRGQPGLNLGFQASQGYAVRAGLRRGAACAEPPVRREGPGREVWSLSYPSTQSVILALTASCPLVYPPLPVLTSWFPAAREGFLSSLSSSRLLAAILGNPFSVHSGPPFIAPVRPQMLELQACSPHSLLPSVLYAVHRPRLFPSSPGILQHTAFHAMLVPVSLADALGPAWPL